jgi:hypothetical protein
MKVQPVVILLVTCFACEEIRAGSPAQDPPEPPVRLKKKEKRSSTESDERKLEPALPKEAKPATEGADSTVAGQHAAEVLARVSKNMRISEERLACKDAGEGTRRIQQEIVKDLDALIEQTKRQQQQQASSGNSSSAKDNRHQSNREMPGRQNQPDPTRRPNATDQHSEASANQPGKWGKDQRGDAGKMADLYKDIWGHLPETLRQEMDQYSREKFMDKYSEMLKQYYSTIAEKGHRKGE